MRIESMDASAKLMERAVPAQTIQKTTPAMPGEKNISADNKAVISEKIIMGAVDRANKAMIASRRALEFSIHEGTNEILVKVIDSETKEVIREIPSEKILDMVANILEMAGILVDERR